LKNIVLSFQETQFQRWKWRAEQLSYSPATILNLEEKIRILSPPTFRPLFVMSGQSQISNLIKVLGSSGMLVRAGQLTTRNVSNVLGSAGKLVRAGQSSIIREINVLGSTGRFQRAGHL
jgi:hypothetical protein